MKFALCIVSFSDVSLNGMQINGPKIVLCAEGPEQLIEKIDTKGQFGCLSNYSLLENYFRSLHPNYKLLLTYVGGYRQHLCLQMTYHLI